MVVAGRELALARREEDEAEARLVPAAWEDAGPMLGPLFRLGGRDKKDLTEEEMEEETAMLLADFELTCAGEPAWAIRETVVAFVRGRAGNGFTPNAAEFGRELRALTDPIRGKLGQARKRRREAEEFERDEEIARQPISPETRAKIEAILAAAQAKTDAAMVGSKTATVDLRGPSPAARVAAMTAARMAERFRQAEQAASIRKALSEDGQLFSENAEQVGNDDHAAI